MSQNFTKSQLDKLNSGDTRLGTWYWSNLNAGTTSPGEFLICDIYLPALTIYKGASLVGQRICGGGNTAGGTHYLSDFLVRIYPYQPAYNITISRTHSDMKIRLWQNSTDTSKFKLTYNVTSAHRSFSLNFSEMPHNDWASNPKSIRLGDPRSVADLTGYTYRTTSG